MSAEKEWKEWKEWPTLYKDNGRRMWSITMYISGNTARYETKWGVVGGKIQVGGQSFDKGNTRKTAKELCESRADKLWNDKKTKGLMTTKKESSDEKKENIIFKPMLAHDYHKHPKKVKYPVWSQAKLDGCRCCIYRNNDGKIIIASRQGTPYVMPHIISDVLSMKLYDDENNYNIVLDGELYSYDENFDELSGYIRRDDSECKDKLRLSFVIFDICNHDNMKMTWKQRMKWMNSNIVSTKYISLLDGQELSDESELEPFARHMVDEKGFEGIMLRNYDSLYKINKRSHDLLKFKFFVDSEFVYVGYQTGKGKFSNVPIIKCQTKDGYEFSVTPEGSMEYKNELLSDLKNGKYKPMSAMYTVKYQELTKNGAPRFPVGIRFRDYE